MAEKQTVTPSSSLLMARIIKFRWKQVDEKLPSEVLARKEEILPGLVELVEERKYWDTSDENEGWAPITAIHLLSLTKDKLALDALIYVMYNYSDELGDWLTEDMPSLLSYFGVDAFDSLATVVLDRTLNQWSRDAAARGMMVIAEKSGNDGLRKRAIECLKEAINSERRLETRSWLVSVFSEMKDKDSLPLLKSLCDDGMVDPMITNYAEIEDVYAGRYDVSYMKSDTKDPMDYFREIGKDTVARPEEEKFSKTHPSQIPKTTRQGKKVGRNDPCPCGSGKKYKKCCLKTEQVRISA